MGQAGIRGFDDTVGDWKPIHVDVDGNLHVNIISNNTKLDSDLAITSTGARTVINYTSFGGKTKHTLQIIGRDNTGSFTDVTIVLEGSLNGIDFDSDGLFTLVLTGAGNEIEQIEFPVMAIRANVTVFNKTGDADFDIIIMSI